MAVLDQKSETVMALGLCFKSECQLADLTSSQKVHIIKMNG